MSDDRLPFASSVLKDQLKAKGRRRRDAVGRMARPAASMSRPARNDLLPVLEISYVAVDQIRSPSRQLRKLDPAHVREVAAAIGALGFWVPVILGKENIQLDGGARVEAARLLGLDRVPCLRADHLSRTEQRLLRIAVNRLA